MRARQLTRAIVTVYVAASVFNGDDEAFKLIANTCAQLLWPIESITKGLIAQLRFKPFTTQRLFSPKLPIRNFESAASQQPAMKCLNAASVEERRAV